MSPLASMQTVVGFSNQMVKSLESDCGESAKCKSVATITSLIDAKGFSAKNAHRPHD